MTATGPLHPGAAEVRNESPSFGAAGTPPGHEAPPQVQHSQGVQHGDHNVQINTWNLASSAVIWPVRVGIAPPLADAFQDRARVSERIETALASDGSAVVTQVLQGGGGTGKTQIASSFYRKATGDGVDLAVWVTATTRDSVVSTYARTAAALQLPPCDRPAEMAETLLSFLAVTDRSWLVVLDDVADPADLRGLWPDGPHGRVLVTSRRRDVTRTTGQLASMVEVDVFTPDQAGRFLRQRVAAVLDRPSMGQDVLAEADGLAADLGYLPVALAQAAAVMADDNITCADVRRQLSDSRTSLRRLFPESSADQYALTLATVWDQALGRADALDPVNLASTMAGIASVLDPNGFPEELLLSAATRTYLIRRQQDLNRDRLQDGTLSCSSDPIDHGGSLDQDVTRRALRNLHRLTILTHTPGPGGRSVRMHALAQRSIRELIDSEQREHLIVTAAEALLEVWPDETGDPVLAEVLRTNFIALVRADTSGTLRVGTPEAHAVVARHEMSQLRSLMVKENDVQALSAALIHKAFTQAQETIQRIQ